MKEQEMVTEIQINHDESENTIIYKLIYVI